MRDADRAPSSTHRRLLLACCLALPAAVCAEGDAARQVLGDGVQLTCTQPQAERLDCRYRLVYGGQAGSAHASLGNTTLPAPRVEQATPDLVAGTLLILVDTSDPARAETVAGNVRHVLTLLDNLPATQAVGIAAFDSTLRVLAAPGASRDDLDAASRGLSAVGRTTEGYRSTLEAVRMLASSPPGRRTLLVMSDGLFEDRAYFHRDVVDAAREAGVVIHALGYARSVSLSVALQTLRRLAEETGGLFSVANPSRPLPSSFLDALLAGLQGGGRVVVDLAPGILAATSGGTQPVRIELVTANGIARASVPVEVPAPLPPAAPEPIVIEVPVPAPAPAAAPAPAPAPPASPAAPVAASPPPPAAGTVPYWYALVGAGIAALLVLLAWMLFRRRGEATPAKPVAPMQTLAILETEDGTGTRYPVMSALFRIGRHGDNDLVLDDASISRYHAELQRHRDGSFSVRDLESLNGVFVNGEQVQDGVVNDGDMLEIGDVALRFRGQSSADLSGEATVILKTAMPTRPPPDAVAVRRH